MPMKIGRRKGGKKQKRNKNFRKGFVIYVELGEGRDILAVSQCSHSYVTNFADAGLWRIGHKGGLSPTMDTKFHIGA